MANQTADREPNRQEDKVAEFDAAGAQDYHRGEALAFNAGGYLDKAADTADFFFAGVCSEGKDLTDDSDGDEKVSVYREGTFEFTFNATATQANVGDEVTAVDSQTVDLAANTTNDIVVGRIVEFIDATTVRVAIRTV